VIPAARPTPPGRWARVGAYTLWALTMLGVALFVSLGHLLRQAGRSDLSALQIESIPLLVAVVSAASVGVVVAVRRPTHPVGWLLLGLGLLVALGGIIIQYVHYGIEVRPGAVPAATYLAGVSNGIGVLWLACGGFILALTPTGTLPSRRWRWWARAAAAAPVLLFVLFAVDRNPLEHPRVENPLAVPPALVDPLLIVAALAGVIFLVTLLMAAWSLVMRFRRARGVERLQLRWLAFAAVLAAAALLVMVGAGVMGKDGVVLAAVGTCLALLPLATGAAILRYRLYDLDRIISRTLAYGVLTLLLGVGYAGLVLALGQLVGQDSSVTVAVATLTVAAVFQPTRRRVQQAVDRRFNRRRYDAALTIAAFGARLRQQVDLDTLTAELLGAVDQTMQPAGVSLWLRPHIGVSLDQHSTGGSRSAWQSTAASPSVRTGL
jgi:hypothetical protein